MKKKNETERIEDWRRERDRARHNNNLTALRNIAPRRNIDSVIGWFE